MSFRIRATTVPNSQPYTEGIVDLREAARASRPVQGDIVTVIGYPRKKYEVITAGMKIVRVKSVDGNETATFMLRDVMKEVS